MAAVVSRETAAAKLRCQLGAGQRGQSFPRARGIGQARAEATVLIKWVVCEIFDNLWLKWPNDGEGTRLAAGSGA